MNLNWRLYTNTTLQFYKIADNVDRFLWLDSVCTHARVGDGYVSGAWHGTVHRRTRGAK